MRKIYYFHLRFWVRLAIRLFYRNVEIQGEENLPMEGPVLLAPNHQNAFMDALLPATLCPRIIHFLVRADVFKSSLARKFFESIHMMPVYRQRDGIQNLAKNEETFEKCYEILRSGQTLLLFPEATHEGVRKLRPLSKGFSRILFGALEGHEDLDIQVVPYGLNYSNYSDSQSTVLISYGKPISVQDYHDQFIESKPKAMNMLKNDLFEALSKEIIHVEGENAMRAFDIELDRILPFLVKSDTRRKNPFYKSRELALEKLDDDSAYFRRIFVYDAEMKKRKLNAPFFYLERKGAALNLLGSVFLLLSSPLYLLAWLIHLPGYALIKFFLGKYIKDIQFHSSLKLVGMMLLFPFFGFIAALTLIFLNSFPYWMDLTILASIPLSVLVVRELRLPYRYNLTFWRMLIIRLAKKDLYKYLKQIESEVVENITVHENNLRHQ
ncbi:MAG: lysophospholipid acyltransferase family protein [Flavobacteriales bacterium]|nr:lysophospholipid acyltransferase family protein [Flavobacteriales bacterium]